jgi:hypothetical protein
VTPRGYKLAQLRAEQPTTVYGDFNREVVTEIARWPEFGRAHQEFFGAHPPATPWSRLNR